MTLPIEPKRDLPKEDRRVEGKGRRRFLGAGTALTPVILTMFSQPALGTTCFTPSRAVSKNTSISQRDHIGECTGAQSPGNYSQQTNTRRRSYSWPIDPATEFHSVFAQGSRFGTTFVKEITTTKGVKTGQWRSMTMLEVLNLDGTKDPQKMAFHLIGAYLNCLGGGGSRISPLAMTPEKVQTIWAEWATKGYYEVTAGVRWGADDIKKYLIDNGIVK